MALVVFSRAAPLSKSPLPAYGYDYGFYLYAAESSAFTAGQNFFSGLFGGYNNPLFLIFNQLRLPLEFSLTFSYLIFTWLLGLSLYMLWQPVNKRAGLLALLLYALSPVQMESYLMFLYKNTFALPFMILGFKFLMYPKKQILTPDSHEPGDALDGFRQQIRRYWPFLLLSLLVVLAHRTTTVIYLLTIGIYFVWLIIRNRRWKFLVLFSTLGLLILGSWFFFFNLKSIIYNLITHNNYYVRTGLFLPLENPLKFIWPYLLLAIPGAWFYLKRREHPLPVIFTLLCILWLILQLPFYRRIWIYFDLALIVFAAYFLTVAIKNTRLNRSLIMIVIVFLGFRFTAFTLAKSPLIRSGEIQEIKTFSQPSGMILAPSANDAPWLLAYADKSQRLGAPGLLEDPHTYAEWTNFWQGQNQRLFLFQYPRPLYFYQRTWRLTIGEAARCLKPLTRNFSEVDYDCLESYSP